MSDIDDRKRLEGLIVSLIVEYPFFGYLIAQISRQLTETVPTLAVYFKDSVPYLMVNPNFLFNELHSDVHRLGALKHEVLHLVLKHPLRTLDYDSLTWNLACDITVNELLKPDERPPNAIGAEDFPSLNLPPDLSAMETYSRIQDAGIRVNELIRGHENWFGPSPQEKIKAAARIDRALRETLLRLRGDAAVGLTPALRSLLCGFEKGFSARMDWRRSLSLFAANGAYRRKPTKSRPSRRFETFPGMRIRKRRTLAIAIDTSGSIGDESLRMFFHQVQKIHDTGAELTIVSCDDQVREVIKYDGTFPDAALGGGGTAFEPVMRWVNEHQYFDGLVYLTDGCGPPPETRPRCRLLWVLTGSPEMGDHLPFGPVTSLEDHIKEGIYD